MARLLKNAPLNDIAGQLGKQLVLKQVGVNNSDFVPRHE
jgi:hypothetical protein